MSAAPDHWIKYVSIYSLVQIYFARNELKTGDSCKGLKMPSPAALSCENTSGSLPVVALLDLGECALSMAPCYLTVSSSTSEFPL